MKTKLLTFATAGLMLAGCQPESGFKITGKIAGLPDSKVYLLAPNNGKTDTLTQTTIIKEVFELTGKADSLEIAYLAIEGQRGALPIFIENGVFEINMDLRNPLGTKIKGGANQEVANQFNELQKELQMKIMPLNRLYQQALQANDVAKVDSLMGVFNNFQKEAFEKENTFIKANGNSPVAAYIIVSNRQTNLEDLKKRFDLLGEKGKNSQSGKKIAARLAQLEKVSVGQVAPNFTLTTPEGTSFSLSDLKGKVKLLDFWASWCGPCRKENPHVVKIYKEFHSKGLEILGISLDNKKEDWEKAIKDDGLIWKHVSDLKGWRSAAAQLYMVSSIPHTVLLDENNRIVATNLRGDALKTKIAEMLK